MRNEQLARAMDMHRAELKSIYHDTLWIVDNLRLLTASLNARVEFNQVENDAYETVLNSIASIQDRIEKRIPAILLY